MTGSLDEQPKIIAPVSTLQLIRKDAPKEAYPAKDDPTAIPSDSHWVDLTEEGTVLVIDQPLDMRCAAVGGIMAARMKVRGLKAAVISGRVRDLGELKEVGLPVSHGDQRDSPRHCQNPGYKETMERFVGISINY